MNDLAFRLNDTQMAHFLAHGYATITPDLPDEFHTEVYAQHEEVFEREGNPGNNLLPRIPMVRQIFEHPSVVGALKSVIGDDYYLQPHRHPHHNPAHSKGQDMHQDGGKRWSHRTRYLLAFYYPQDTPIERGPSGIVPGSHYFNTSEGAQIDQELPLVTPAGSITITHYDLWHRAMPNHSDRHRFMIKFLFARMDEPETPSWNNQQTKWPGATPALTGDSITLSTMYEHAWHWHRGTPIPVPPNNCDPTDLLPLLQSEQERIGIAAAYDLAAFGSEVVPSLIQTLGSQSEMTRRHAAYALSAVGEPAIDALVETLQSDDPSMRTDAATILGDIGYAATPGVNALINATKDAEATVRQRAAEALGIISRSPAPVPALIDALADPDVSVRTAATFALCRLGPQAAEAISVLERVLNDENRYVRGDALFALQRINTAEAKDTLIKHLMPARWCSLTTPESTF